jgi:hypothetical protein
MRTQAPPVVFTGGATVIASGTVIAFNDWGEIRFQIGPLEERLSIVFMFKDGPIGPEPRIEVLPQDEKTITLLLHDFGSPTGEGTTSPLKLGTLDGLQLYVHFRVFRVGRAPRTFHYTFYLRAPGTLQDMIDGVPVAPTHR